MGIFKLYSGDLAIGRLVTGKNCKKVVRQCRLFRHHANALIWEDIKSGNLYARGEEIDSNKIYIEELVQLKDINCDICYYKKSQLKQLANEIDKLNYKNNDYAEKLENHPNARLNAHALIKTLTTK